MKNKFLILIGFLSFFTLKNQSFAQGDQAPWGSWLETSPDSTQVEILGEFHSQTAMPTTITVSYWLLPSGFEIQDTSFVVNNLSFSLTVDGLEQDSPYSIRMTCVNIYGTYLWDIQVNTTSVGVGEITKDDFNLFPNPVSSELFIQNADAGAAVVVNNMLGKTVLSGSIESTTKPEQISFENQPAGIYFVTTTAGGKMVTRKIQKK